MYKKNAYNKRLNIMFKMFLITSDIQCNLPKNSIKFKNIPIIRVLFSATGIRPLLFFSILTPTY